MRSTSALVAAFAAFASYGVLAQDPNFDSIDHPLKDEKINAGQTYTITWTLLKPDTPTGPVTITLIGGQSTQALNPIKAIGHVNNDAGKFAWAVDASLGSETVYGLNISLDADSSHFQYSNPFQIVGGASASAATSTTVTVTANNTSPPVVTTSTSTAVTGSASAETTAPVSTTSEPVTSTLAPASSAARNATISTSVSATAASTSNTTVSTSTPTTVSSSAAGNLQVSAMASALILGLAAIWGLV